MKVCSIRQDIVKIIHTHYNYVQTSLHSHLSLQQRINELGKDNALLPNILHIYWGMKTFIMAVNMMIIPVVV